MRLLCVPLALGLAVSAGSAADLVRCPLRVAVKEQLAGPVPGWSVTSEGLPHELAGLTFFDGKPEDKASLAPDREAPGKGKIVSTWTFGAGDRAVWVACRYAWTNLILTRELPKKTRTCTVTYASGETIAGLPAIQKVDCQ